MLDVQGSCVAEMPDNLNKIFKRPFSEEQTLKKERKKKDTEGRKKETQDRIKIICMYFVYKEKKDCIRSFKLFL